MEGRDRSLLAGERWLRIEKRKYMREILIGHKGRMHQGAGRVA